MDKLNAIGGLSMRWVCGLTVVAVSEPTFAYLFALDTARLSTQMLTSAGWGKNRRVATSLDSQNCFARRKSSISLGV